MNTHKLGYIEGIRGLAALVVVLHHYTLAFYPALTFATVDQANIGNGSLELFFARSPLNIVYNGGFAVCMFFILSGFVLSNAYHRSNRLSVLSEYAVKRYARLWVPVSVSIVIAYVFEKTGIFCHTGIGAISKSGDWLDGAFHEIGNIPDMLQNMFFNVFFFMDNRYNPVLWTMSYELLGSLMIFSFLFIIHPLRHKGILYFILITTLVVIKSNFYAAFILGVALNRYCVNGYILKFNGLPYRRFLLVVLFLTGIYLGAYPPADISLYRLITFPFLVNHEFYHVLGCFLLMFVILHSERLKNGLSGKFLSYLGKISFSFYLLHFIILCSFSAFLFRLFYPACNYHWAVLFSFLISIPVMAISAHFYYLFVDKKGILLSEKIARIVMPEKSTGL